MLKSFSPLMLLLLAGCASTQQTAVTPASDNSVSLPVAQATQAASEQIATEQTANPATALGVSDVTPTAAVSAPEPIQTAASPVVYEPYPCMVSWMKGMQDAMAPWAVTAQRCDTRAPQP